MRKQLRANSLYCSTCVSLSFSLCFSVSFFVSSFLYSLFRSLRSCFLFSPSHLTSFDSVFFKASFAFFPSRFCVLDRISFRLYRDGMTELSFQTLHGYIYIYKHICVCVYIYTYIYIYACASDQNGSRYD